jgi:hypothetical protein
MRSRRAFVPLRRPFITSGFADEQAGIRSFAGESRFVAATPVIERCRQRGRAIALALMLVAAAPFPARADTPVLVELFTAEGCSSCPPADHFLEQLDAAQPVRGASLLVLSEHVDYWDRQGWPDPFASKAFTERQQAYERGLRISEPFTPQFIIDGTIDMRLSRRDRISDQLHSASLATKTAMSIESLRIETAAAPAISGIVSAEALQGHRSCGLFVGIALDRAETEVLRGENRGRHLTHVAVLRQLVALGTVASGSAAHQPFSFPLQSGLDHARVRVVAFLQEPGPGAVLGAAEQTIGP